MKTSWFLAAGVLTLASLPVWSAEKCAPQDLSEFVEGKEAREQEFVKLAGELLLAECRCSFPADLKRRITRGDGEFLAEDEEPADCRGSLSLFHVEVDDGFARAKARRRRGLRRGVTWHITGVMTEDGWTIYRPIE